MISPSYARFLSVTLDPALGAAWFVLAAGGQALGALAAGPSRLRRVAAMACMLGPVAPALFFPAPLPFQRAILWLVFALFFMRMVDVISEADRPADFRLALALGVFDIRDMTRRLPGLDRGALFWGALWSIVFALALLQARAISSGPFHLGRATVYPVHIDWHGPIIAPIAHQGWAMAIGWPLRWIAGAAAIYALVEAVGATGRLGYGLLGLRAQRLQRTPVLARSLTEFWGRRWNREVGRWLHRWCFLPLARRGFPALGLVAAFTWSGAFHAASVFAGLGWRGAVPMGAFFLVQGLLVWIERLLGVARWPPAAGRAWTIGLFALSMPLFVEPVLQLFGI